MNKTIEKFKKGVKYVNIASAVTREHLTSTDLIRDDYLNLKCVKFIPACGAATRMWIGYTKLDRFLKVM